jgi:L-glyceraldehyde 3-phosphate reductase
LVPRSLFTSRPNSLLNRWIEDRLLGVLETAGVGCIIFSPLAQGLLTSKYLDGVPAGSRMRQGRGFPEDVLTADRLARVRSLTDIARGRGQTLAQFSIAWALRDQRVTSALIGPRTVEQLEENVAAIEQLAFTADELAEIDRHAVESHVNLWKPSVAVKP